MTSQEWRMFLPVESVEEAVDRIYAICGSSPGSRGIGGSRGVRKALSAAARACGIDEDPSWTSAALAARIAASLGTTWGEQHILKTGLRLGGLNLLIQGLADAKRAGLLQGAGCHSTSELPGSSWPGFQPAPSKIEAVTRIAALTGSPRESLGPGSKERKSALVNLAAALFPGDPAIDPGSKHRLAATLASRMGAPWASDCVATGQTVTLQGLNSLLAGAERHLGRLGETVIDALNTPELEGGALAAALLAELPRHWDGRRSVRWLAANGLRGANDTEWQGFYGEERARAILDRSFTPRRHAPRRDYGWTTFDYALSWPWDIKVHTSSQTLGSTGRGRSVSVILNDERATRECVAEQGLGFLIVSGTATMDHSGEFKEWHDRWKHKRTGRIPSSSNSGRSRMRKSGFTPTHVDAYWIDNPSSLADAEASRAMSVRKQGRQAPARAGAEGAQRLPKFEMNLERAADTLRVASLDWPAS